MQFRPLHDRVVIKRIDAEIQVHRRHHYPRHCKGKTSNRRDHRRRARRARRGGQARADDLKVGDKVLFGKWSGTEVKLDGVELLIMKESDIMGVLDGPSEARAE